MKTFKILPALILTLLCFTAQAQSKMNKIPQDGVVVVEFNAGWNSSKNVTWLNKLKEAEVGRLLIDENPKFQSKYKIVVVPTLIVFKDGVEIQRFQANIMMDMEATLEDVQEGVDDAHMEGF